jgi:CspA family cold shock protein
LLPNFTPSHIIQLAKGLFFGPVPVRLPCRAFKGAIDVATGTVKWFNPTKGYGFIQPSDGGKDVFVHISAVERAGLSNLQENSKIEYEVVTGRNGKSSAENLKLR